MKRLLFFLTALILVNLQASQAQPTRASLQLNGANVHHVSTAADGSLVFAACQGPLGLFYSTDFGATWNDARGGDYSSGEGRQTVIMTSRSEVWALAGNKIYKANTGTPSTWTEETAASALDPYFLGAFNTFLIIGTREGNIAVYDITSSTVVANSDITGATERFVTSAAIDGTNGFIYAVHGEDNFEQAQVFRATFNTTTGAIGTWALAEPATANTFFTFVGVATNGDVYVGTQNATANNGIYKSTDNGATYARIMSGGSAVDDNAVFGYFLTTRLIVGDYVSSDAGVTWARLPGTSDGTSLNPNAGAINPANTNQALISSDVGIAKTSNLSSGGASTWAESNSGLEGMVVNGIDQVDGNKDRVLFATKSGMAFSDNFTDSTINWVYPIIPLGNGAPARDTAFDPNNEDRVFAGYNQIYEGAINDSVSPPTITWTEVAARDVTYPNFLNNTELEAFNSTKVAATFAQNEQVLYGRLRIYDISSGGFTLDVNALEGKPVNSFEAVTSSIYYAAVGGRFDNLANSTDTTNRGVWKSTDSGVTWTQEIDGRSLGIEESVITSLAYDALNDLLFASASDISAATSTTRGTVYILKNASSGSGVWRAVPSADLDRDQQYSNITVDPSTGDVYVSASNKIYLSTDNGRSWTLYYTGLENEDTSVLFFDDLVQCSTAGCFGFSNSASLLTSPTFVGWNTFNNANTFLELVNRGDSSLSVEVTLYDADGTERGEQTVVIPPTSQRDLAERIIFPQVEDNSYGTMEIEWEGTSNLLGRSVVYSPRGNGQYNYVYTIPFRPGKIHTSALTYNTFQPSQNPSETGIVENWVTIMNTSEEQASFDVHYYTFQGTLIKTVGVTVPAMGRRDLSGGHDQSDIGLNKYGLIIIEPTSADSSYRAELVRFGQRLVDGENYKSYAIHKESRSGSSAERWVFFSRGAGGQNFLELINPTAEEITVDYDIFNGESETPVEDGTGEFPIPSSAITLAAYSQFHFPLNDYIAEGKTGAMRIAPRNEGRAIARVITYYRDFQNNILTAAKSRLRRPRNGALWGTWNSFLGHQNWLRAFNTGTSAETLTLTVKDAVGGATESTTITLDPKAGLDTYVNALVGESSENKYGSIKVVPGSQEIAVDLTRVRFKPNSGEIDYIVNAPLD